MVWFFTASSGHLLYMVGTASENKSNPLPSFPITVTIFFLFQGKDKYENEDLIRYGLPEVFVFVFYPFQMKQSSIHPTDEPPCKTRAAIFLCSGP